MKTYHNKTTAFFQQHGKLKEEMAMALKVSSQGTVRSSPRLLDRFTLYAWIQWLNFTISRRTMASNKISANVTLLRKRCPVCLRTVSNLYKLVCSNCNLCFHKIVLCSLHTSLHDCNISTYFCNQCISTALPVFVNSISFCSAI